MEKEKDPEPIIVQGAPEWMVSFSDLNTLLLTFFILLIVFAKERKAGMMDAGEGMHDSPSEFEELDGPYRGPMSSVVVNHVRRTYKTSRIKVTTEEKRRDNIAITFPGIGKNHVTLKKIPVEIGQHFSFEEPFDSGGSLKERAKAELNKYLSSPVDFRFLVIESTVVADDEENGNQVAYERAKRVAAYVAAEHGGKIRQKIQVETIVEPKDSPSPDRITLYRL